MAVVADVIVGVGALYYDVAGAPIPGILFGYTEDGVTIEYSADVADIEVEEETFAINRVITKEEVTITCNLAENLLANLRVALPGASGVAPIINLGAGAMQTLSLRFVGGAPVTGGLTIRTIYAQFAHPIGPVGMAYKKGEKTLIPVAFKAYQGEAGGYPIIITDS